MVEENGKNELPDYPGIRREGKVYYCKCSKCGEDKFTMPAALEKRIQKFGSVEALVKGYICRSCGK